MGNLRPFQIVLLAVFGAMALGALILLGAYQANVSRQAKIYGDSVLIWGTFDELKMQTVFEEVIKDDAEFAVVDYWQFDERTFEGDLVNAIAEGRGPDMIIMNSNHMVTLRPKLTAIGYETLSLRTFRDLFVDGAELFTYPEGVYAIPFAVDPLMLYWNRDLYAAAGVAQAPKSWEQLVNLVVPSLTVIDTSRTVLQSAVAFGEYRNLVNAKAILMMLTMQSGSRLVYLDEQGYQVGINDNVDENEVRRPLELAVEFFTEFSNSNSQLYSWNRAQPSDIEAFLAGDLATYFGLYSEYVDIQNKNPNLNFDVAMVPQGEMATIRRTYGEFYGFAIPQAAPNVAGAYQAALTLTEPQIAQKLAETFNLVPARRDLLTAGSANPVTQSAMTASLVARGWLDPAPERTDTILQELIDSVVSNRERVPVAARQAITYITNEY